VIALALAAVTVALPSPLHPLSPQPPLGGQPIVETEGILHRVRAATRVDVRVDAHVRPFAVRALQRLVVLDKGDYVFAIPAPVEDVRAAPGSDSTPGQRRTSILWSGFAAGRKVLAADAMLAVRETAPYLPLRIEARGGTITLVNATSVTAGAFEADAVVRPLARYFAAVRRTAVRGAATPIGTAEITTRARPVQSSIEAPLQVRGTVGGNGVDTVLGDGRPLRLSVARGDGRIRLEVTPVPPLRLLADAPTTGRALLARVNAVLLRLARMRQYDAFLANPDPRGRTATTFVYRSGRPPKATPPAAVAPETGRSALATALVVAGLIAAAAAGLVVWARS
jgi:hypothetical protein